VIVKCNAVTDPPIVRGVCVLRPGLPGVSDRVRVRSIVGRFLEHSRLYSFENGGKPEVFLGSADLMDRNLDRRVETLCRVSDAELGAHLRDVVLNTYLQDNVRAYELTDRTYRRPESSPDTPIVDAQHLLHDWYTSRMRRTAEGEPLAAPGPADCAASY
jgi:polyphosphate kinase